MSPGSWCVMLAIFGACASGPDDGDLDRLHAEAVKANAELIAKNTPTNGGDGFDLAVVGQLKKAVPSLSWPELEAMATTHVQTVNVQDPSAPDRVVDFRGVLLRDLLDKEGALPTATEVTLVSLDGFRSTVSIADARKWRMLLAIAADDKPIAKSMGGPIFLVLPYSESPEIRAKYPDRYWAFYVQAVIVGTEPTKLRVGGQRFDRAQLESLPTATYANQVGWKVDWPIGTVQVRGVRLTDVLDAAHVTLPADGRVIVRGKSWVSRDPKEPVAIAIADLKLCQPMLALRWGPEDERIPARLGGPIAMVMPSTPQECADRYPERYWMTFVEELYVEAK